MSTPSFTAPPPLMRERYRLRVTPSAALGPKTLGVDYGLRRVGLAVSVGIAPRALPRVEHSRDPKRAAAQVAQAATESLCTDIVVGMPVDAHGREGEQADATRAFLSELAQAAPWARLLALDERYTSSEAREVLLGAGVRREEVPGLVDSASAVVLLNRFFTGGDEESAVVIREPDQPREEEVVELEEVVSFREWKRVAMQRASADACNSRTGKR